MTGEPFQTVNQDMLWNKSSPSSSQPSDSATSLILCNYLTSQNRSKSCGPGATAMHHSTLTCTLQCYGRVKTRGTVEVVLGRWSRLAEHPPGRKDVEKINKFRWNGSPTVVFSIFKLMQRHLKMHPLLSIFAFHLHCAGNFHMQKLFFSELISEKQIFHMQWRKENYAFPKYNLICLNCMTTEEGERL